MINLLLVLMVINSFYCLHLYIKMTSINPKPGEVWTYDNKNYDKISVKIVDSQNKNIIRFLILKDKPEVYSSCERYEFIEIFKFNKLKTNEEIIKDIIE